MIRPDWFAVSRFYESAQTSCDHGFWQLADGNPLVSRLTALSHPAKTLSSFTAADVRPRWSRGKSQAKDGRDR